MIYDGLDAGQLQIFYLLPTLVQPLVPLVPLGRGEIEVSSVPGSIPEPDLVLELVVLLSAVSALDPDWETEAVVLGLCGTDD